MKPAGRQAADPLLGTAEEGWDEWDWPKPANVGNDLSRCFAVLCTCVVQFCAFMSLAVLCCRLGGAWTALDQLLAPHFVAPSMPAPS